MAKSKKNTETLKKAADVLQRAHDYIEVNGFDIGSYGTLSSTDSPAPACYIGTVRIAAGVNPEDAAFVSWSDAAEGDGPELIEALTRLDRIARRRLVPYRREGVKHRFNFPTGRFVEELGFQIQGKAEKKFPYPDFLTDDGVDMEKWDIETLPIDQQRVEFQRDYALKLLRKALTDIHTEVK